MMLKRAVLTFIFFFQTTAYASLVSYSTIESFHRSKIESLMEEYDLKERAKVTFSLSPINGVKNEKNDIVKLPGLLLDVISLNSVKKETGLVEIVDALKDYKRKITILKTSKTSDKEIAVLKQALTEELYLDSQENFNVKPWSNQKTWAKSFTSAFYQKVLLSPWALIGLLCFAVVSFLLYSMSTSILKGLSQLGKSIFDGIEKSISSRDLGEEPEENFNDLEASAAGLELENVDQIDGAFQNEDFQNIDCSLVLKQMLQAQDVKPHEFNFRMLESFSKIEEQLNLYVFFEAGLKSQDLVSFDSLYKSVFKAQPVSSHLNLKKNSGDIKKTIWELRLTLTHLTVSPTDRVKEEIFSIVTKEYSGQIDKIIENLVMNHFNVLSYVFNNRIMHLLNHKKEIDEQLSIKVVNYIAQNDLSLPPTEVEIKSFERDLVKNSHFKNSETLFSNSEEMNIFKKLPDDLLFSKAGLGEEVKAALKTQIPNLSWVHSEDKNTSKRFLLSLTSDEAAHFVQNYGDYQNFKTSLESRVLSRLQELEIKSKNPNSSKAILGLRSKIGRYFVPPVQTEQEIGQEEESVRAA